MRDGKGRGMSRRITEETRMSSNPRIIPAVVKDGVVVPEGEALLPEGTRVEIVLPLIEVTPELQAELNAGDRASADASQMIDQWEREE